MSYMPALHVSSLQAAQRDAIKFRATRVLSIIDPETPAPIFDATHTVMRFHDVDGATHWPAWTVAPFAGHVRIIIELARSLDPNDRVLIHCHAGISRSPAAAMIIIAACTSCADTARHEIKRILPHGLFEPNRRMLRFADRLLRLPTPLCDPVPRPAPSSRQIFSW